MAARRARRLSSLRITVQGVRGVWLRASVSSGGAVGLPLVQAFDVDAAELPLFEGALLALEEAAKLFGAADVEPELEEVDALVDQHALEIRYLSEERLAFGLGAEAEDMFDHAAIVPAAVIEHDLPPGGQVVDITLEIPLCGLGVGGFGERHHPRAARVEVLAEPLDGAALSGGIAPLEDDGHARTGLARPVLEFDQFDLEVLKFLFIDLLGHAFGIGKAGVQHVALVSPADGVTHLARGVGFEKGADRAVIGELHAGPHSCGAPLWPLTPAGAIRRGWRRGGWRR